MHDENFESNQLTETSSFCVSVADGFSDELSIFFLKYSRLASATRVTWK